MRDLLTDSDIVVDELYSATVGGLSSEAMATGNVVLVRYMADYCKVPEGCPAINVNKFTLKDNLRQIILDVDRRKELANLGRPYVENANDHLKICRDLLSWVEQKDTIDYDFYPTFSKDFQIPEQILKDEERETGKKRVDFFKTLLSTGATKKKQSY
ncbi:MAG: glycosyltransferase [Flammeovirgaceae bacterium]|nr:glycosyltransferase [Flammeovirgaceae bacterium]